MSLALQVRRLWPDHNPLRRAAHRAEFAIALLLLAGFLAGAPLLALAAAAVQHHQLSIPLRRRHAA